MDRLPPQLMAWRRGRQLWLSCSLSEGRVQMTLSRKAVGVTPTVLRNTRVS